jgi:TolB-like protein/Tfp pilus assembly protein PilF
MGNSVRTGASTPFERQVRARLDCILRTSGFASDPRSTAFLSYVVEAALSGRSSEIKESTLGVDVFGRTPGYDCRTDSIVRTQARRVREKLGEYYLSAGQNDPIRIEIPKGSYVPDFRIPEPSMQPVGQERPSGFAAWKTRRTAVIAALAVLLIAGSLIASAWLFTPPTHLPAIAVLPFADLNPERGHESLANGLTEDLERDLSRVRNLRIHARPPAGLLAEERGPDYASLSRRLKVDAVLDGQIVSTPGHTEIRASLIHASDNVILWTDRFSSDGDVLAIERQIEQGVASALRVNLPALVRTENPKAHDLFFAGRSLWATRTPANINDAIALYRQALQLDPNYALAYVGIADAYGIMAAHSQIDVKTGVELGEQAARRALHIDPSLAEAHAALGLLDYDQWKWKDADTEFQLAIQLNPSYDRAYSREGIVRFYLGDFPAAERLIRESEHLNPYAMSLPLIRAELYYYWRRFDDSEDLIREVQKAEPKNAAAFQFLSVDFLARRQPAQALEAARSALSEQPDSLGLQTIVAPCLQATGNSAEAAKLIEILLKPGLVNPYSLALMYARMGDKENTLRRLEESLTQRIPDLPSLRWDPAFDLVRTEPRYQAIVERVYGHE